MSESFVKSISIWSGASIIKSHLDGFIMRNGLQVGRFFFSPQLGIEQQADMMMMTQGKQDFPPLTTLRLHL